MDRVGGGSPVRWQELQKGINSMHKIRSCAIGALISVAVIVCGCVTKTRSVELAGMYLSEAGTLAIGSVDVMASPTGEASVFVKYDEDNAWLAPSMKLHDIKIMLTGTNSCEHADALVKSICDAFVASSDKVAKKSESDGLSVVEKIFGKKDAEKSDEDCKDCTPAEQECEGGVCTPEG